MTFDDYIKQAKAFILKRAVKQVFKILVTKLPFLSWGPVGPLVQFLLKIVIKLAIYETDMSIFFLYTDVRVNAQGREFYQAAEDNMRVQKEGTEQEKKDAEKFLIDSFRNLVKLSN